MKKYHILGDPKNKEAFSSKIIIDALNKAAKDLNLYDESGLLVCYDGVCNSHGYDVDAFLCLYEIVFPKAILNNAGNKPIIGTSKHNLQFILDGGHDPNLSGYCLLGIDAKKFEPISKTKNLDKFVVCSYSESLVRGGMELVVESFGEAFKGNKDTLLIIKDRNGTDQFERWIRSKAIYYDIQIEYINDHFGNVEQIRELFRGVDVHLYLNRSSTWSMPPLESMAMGIPTVAPAYSGPAEYIIHDCTGMNVLYDITRVRDDIKQLQSIGCRNFFFPGGYKKEPTWATTVLEDVAACLTKIKDDEQLRQKLSKNGISFAKQLTWERAAVNLSEVLSIFNL